MPRRPARLFFILSGAVVVTLGLVRGAGANHLLISEVAVTPTDAEFIEIYNPTAETIDLTDYYLSDWVFRGDAAEHYYRIVDGALDVNTSFQIDFIAQFPPGTKIFPGQSYVVSLHDDAAFTQIWREFGFESTPDFEFTQDGNGDGVSDMKDPGLDLVGAPYILADAGLSNSRELVILFFWDGESDLVQDVDIMQWSNDGPDFITLGEDKTGVSIDGPDPDTTPSTYLPDTEPLRQDLVATEAHAFERTFSRVDFSEGTETQTGGNGLTGHDETSENYSETWLTSTIPSFGSPGEFGPPTVLGAAARSATEVELTFSRALDAASAETPRNYIITRLQTAAGGPGLGQVAVEDAELDASGSVVTLTTDPLEPLAFYEVRPVEIFAEGGGTVLVPGSRTFFRGFNPGPGLRLEVPHRPFVPHLDRQMEISYIAPQGETVLLRVFDVQGRELFVMTEESVPAGGLRTMTWDGRDHLRQRLPAGLYYLHLEMPRTGDETVAPLVVAVSDESSLR